jgi:hypothetical protein
VLASVIVAGIGAVALCRQVSQGLRFRRTKCPGQSQRPDAEWIKDHIESWPRYSASEKGASTLDSDRSRMRANTRESEIAVVEGIDVR